MRSRLHRRAIYPFHNTLPCPLWDLTHHRSTNLKHDWTFQDRPRSGVRIQTGTSISRLHGEVSLFHPTRAGERPMTDFLRTYKVILPSNTDAKFTILTLTRDLASLPRVPSWRPQKVSSRHPSGLRIRQIVNSTSDWTLTILSLTTRLASRLPCPR